MVDDGLGVGELFEDQPAEEDVQYFYGELGVGEPGVGEFEFFCSFGQVVKDEDIGEFREQACAGILEYISVFGLLDEVADIECDHEDELM